MKHWLHVLSFGVFIASTAAVTDNAHAQYTFKKRTAPYQPLQTEQVLEMRWDDTVNPYTYVGYDGLAFKVFGEEFAFNSKYPIAISKWGNVEIRNANSVVIIDPFHTSAMDSVKPTAKVSAMVDGTEGDYIMKIQWKDMGFESAPPDLYTNFQMWMYQRTGDIEFHYGPHNIGCDPSDPTLQGAYVGLFIAPPDFSSIRKIYWVYGSPEDPKISKMQIRAMKCVFDENTVVTLAAPVAGVSETEVASTPMEAIYVQDRTLTLANASDVKLYSIMGQMILSEGTVNGELSLQHISAGRYFIEYQEAGEFIRRALIIE